MPVLSTHDIRWNVINVFDDRAKFPTSAWRRTTVVAAAEVGLTATAATVTGNTALSPVHSLPYEARRGQLSDVRVRRSRSYSPRRRGSPTYSPVRRSYSRSRSRSRSHNYWAQVGTPPSQVPDPSHASHTHYSSAWQADLLLTVLTWPILFDVETTGSFEILISMEIAFHYLLKWNVYLNKFKFINNRQ